MGSGGILITRPRRWGKTLNMSMLHHFFADTVYNQKTAGLFDNLLIAKEDEGYYLKEHQGKYPVIFISLKDVKEFDFAKTLDKIKILIQRLYNEHGYLLKSEKLSAVNIKTLNRYLEGEIGQSELEESLRVLSDLLYAHYNQKVYILIDEYDTPLNSAYGKGYFEEMTSFMKNFFSTALKDNPYLEKGIMTGILRVFKDSMLSGLNNLKVYTVLNEKYREHFGFTDSELDILFSDQGLEKDEQRVKDWYNGYLIGGLTIYNPWSIMNVLDNKGALQPYWVATADDRLLRELLQEADVETKIKFQQLIEGKAIEEMISDSVRFDELKNNATGLWSLLVYTGYLKASLLNIEGIDKKCKLLIPNKEVLTLYKANFIEWLNQSSRVLEIPHLLDNLLIGNIDKFARDIEKFLTGAASVRDYANKPEAFYHGFMLALTSSLLKEYHIESNRESGDGFPDLVFIPKDQNKTKAVILEFKNISKNDDPEKVAKQALEQIEQQNYQAKIKQFEYITEIIKVGLAFNGKNVTVRHAISVN